VKSGTAFIAETLPEKLMPLMLLPEGNPLYIGFTRHRTWYSPGGNIWEIVIPVSSALACSGHFNT
jgi:hypothetical protein